MRKRVAIMGAVIAIVGIVMVFPLPYLALATRHKDLPEKTGTIMPHDYIAFRIEFPEDGEYSWFFHAENSVDFTSFTEECHERFQQGKSIEPIDHIENTTFGWSEYSQGGMDRGGPFYIVFGNSGESTVRVQLFVTFSPTLYWLQPVISAGVELIVTGVIIGVIGFILKPAVKQELSDETFQSSSERWSSNLYPLAFQRSSGLFACEASS